jgi:hypothetical protein
VGHSRCGPRIWFEKGDLAAAPAFQEERLKINRQMKDTDKIEAVMLFLTKIDLSEQKFWAALQALRYRRNSRIAAVRQFAAGFLAAIEK